ncbi:MAG: TIGR00159 family protein [Ignavibacteriae bacterium]|nr:TIGR00159 family protein [Ignavibacteriota bacterium]NOG96549.1 TIGR00159 family protein [Ignavibacteriota bacterium]
MLDLFKIGFFTVSLLDIVDIILVSYLIYKLYTLIRGTIASQIFIGLIIVLLLSITAQAIDLKALSWILKLITDIWVIAFIILFQPEIRRLLLLLGRNPFGRVFASSDEQSVVDIITEASFEMAQHQHGALIVIVKSVGIKGIAETGELLNAKVTKSLIRSIFFPRSPLHDGAAIINGNKIEAVKCTLPLSQKTTINGEALGMRHRAGLGISEEADVITVIVSEETGSISIAEGGKLYRGLSKEALKNKLISSLGPTKDKNWRGIFEQFGRQK